MGFIFDEVNYRLTYGGTLVCKFRKDAARMHDLCRDVAGCQYSGAKVACRMWDDDNDQDTNRSHVQKTVSEFNKKQVVSGGRLLKLHTVDLGRALTINYDRVENGQ